MNKTNKIVILYIIMILYVYFTSTCFATSDANYVWSLQEEQTLLTSTQPDSKSIENNNFLNLESKSAILVEQKTGKVLYSHNAHEQLPPASVTKIMSILIIMEQLDSGKLKLTDQIPCSEKAASMGGSQIWLDTTETLSVDEMLKAICVRKCK